MPDEKLSSVVSSTHAIQTRQLADGTQQEIIYKSPSDNHPIYSLVGRVAAEWALYEHNLDKIIWSLAGLNSVQGACITAQMMGAMPRLNAIKAQLTLRAALDPAFAKHLTRVNKLTGHTRDPQEDRNRIIHDVWLSDDASQATAQFRAWPRNQLEYGIRDVDITKINNTLTAIGKLIGDATTLRIYIIADAGASLRKQR